MITRSTFLSTLTLSLPAWLWPWKAPKIIKSFSPVGRHSFGGMTAQPGEGWESLHEGRSWPSENGAVVGFDPAHAGGDKTFLVTQVFPPTHMKNWKPYILKIKEIP